MYQITLNYKTGEIQTPKKTVEEFSSPKICFLVHLEKACLVMAEV